MTTIPGFKNAANRGALVIRSSSLRPGREVEINDFVDITAMEQGRFKVVDFSLLNCS